MVTDTISDLIIRLKNASSVGKKTFVVDSSKLNLSILEVLKKEGYISELTKKNKKNIKFIEAEIAYGEEGKSKLSGVKRVSKPSMRLYRKAKEIRKIKQGYGLLIISTPKGILTGAEAKRENVGGEPLFEIW